MRAASRNSTLERLSAADLDLVVVGAGITGARIAYDAARNGLRVALVDAGDVAGATSSASSKLLHGGFRYLAQRSYRLVHDAGRERHILATRVAAHLSRPLPVVLTMERGRWPQWQIAWGLALYFGLSGFQRPRPRLLDPAEAREIAPELRAAEERIHVFLPEFQTDDSRLVLATALGAARAGALIAPYVEVVALEGRDGRVNRVEAVDRLDGARLRLRTRAVVNASGPWIDCVRAIEEPGCKPIARLSKGVHVTIPLPADWRALVAYYSPADQTIFAAPWHGTLLLGTTDTEYTGEPGSVAALEEDVRDVLEAAEYLLPPDHVERSHVLSAWAGLRVLPRGEGDTTVAPREHMLSLGPRGVVSIAGGKLTTHRRMSVEALKLLPEDVRPRRLTARVAPLPGAESGSGGRALDPVVGDETAMHLRSLYGSEAEALLEYADAPDAFERIHPSGPDVWAQVRYAVEQEWACTVDDVVWRRTSLAHRGLATEEVRAALAERVRGVTPAASAA